MTAVMSPTPPTAAPTMMPSEVPWFDPSNKVGPAVERTLGQMESLKDWIRASQLGSKFNLLR